MVSWWLPSYQGKGGAKSALVGVFAVALGELSQPIERLDVAAPYEQVSQRVEDERRQPVARVLDHRHPAAASLGLDLHRHRRGAERPSFRTQLQPARGVGLQNLRVVVHLDRPEADCVVKPGSGLRETGIGI